MSKSRRKTVQTPPAPSADPQVALEHLLERIGRGGKATGIRRVAANLAGLYSNFDVLPLSEKGLLQLLGDPRIDRAAISKLACFKAMSRWPLINILGVGERESWRQAARVFLESVDVLCGDALFIGALETEPLHSFALESLLIATRAQLLRNPAQLRHDATLRVALAMARQVDLNEAIWAFGDEDQALLDALPKDNAPATSVLHALYGDFNVVDANAPNAKTNAGHASEFKRWIGDRRAAQARLSNGEVARIGGVSNAVSQKVADHYGDAPYPRWTSLAVPDKGARLAMVRALSPDNRLRGEHRPNVLIAGCGTGHHAIAAALGYGPGSTILGVDLSEPSLTYAAGMAGLFDARNLTFTQMDLLNVAALNQCFDIIESIGVLHHTADPFKSWAVLLKTLKPGGVMAVGVYSATARAGLSRFRENLNGANSPPSNNTVRSIRHKILDSPQNDFERSIAQSADFHTLSNLRDLLFNIHEIPLALQDIRDFLDQHGLTFLRFDAPANIIARFERAHGPAALNNLDVWTRFESENPDAFEGMYVFWIQARPENSTA